MTTLEDIENFEYQKNIADISDQTWDAVVIGAGPAGSYAGIHLAKKDLKVLLIDGARFPRDKTCGDGLIADSIKCLDNVGLLETVRRLGYETGFVNVSSPSGYRVDIAGDYITLKRRYLDAIIAHGALKQGCTFTNGYVENIDINGKFDVDITVKNFSRAIKTKLVFVATGGNISLPQKLNIIKEKNPSGIAIRCYLKSSYDIDKLLISYDKSILPGYAWIFPLGNGEYNVGCGTFYSSMKKDSQRLKEAFKHFMTTFPEAKQLMADDDSAFTLKGCPLRCGLTGANYVTDKQVLAIGETVGTTFPFTGEGIGKAMETGEIAADIAHKALINGKISILKSYSKIIKNDLEPRYFGYNLAQKVCSNQALLDNATKRASNSKRMRDALAGVIAETINPKSLINPAKVLKVISSN